MDDIFEEVYSKISKIDEKALRLRFKKFYEPHPR